MLQPFTFVKQVLGIFSGNSHEGLLREAISKCLLPWMSGAGYSETSKLAGDCHAQDSGGQRLQSRSARNFWNKTGTDKYAWLNEGVMLCNEGRRLTFSSLQVLLLPRTPLSFLSPDVETSSPLWDEGSGSKRASTPPFWKGPTFTLITNYL